MLSQAERCANYTNLKKHCLQNITQEIIDARLEEARRLIAIFQTYLPGCRPLKIGYGDHTETVTSIGQTFEESTIYFNAITLLGPESSFLQTVAHEYYHSTRPRDTKKARTLLDSQIEETEADMFGAKMLAALNGNVQEVLDFIERFWPDSDVHGTVLQRGTIIKRTYEEELQLLAPKTLRWIERPLNGPVPKHHTEEFPKLWHAGKLKR